MTFPENWALSDFECCKLSGQIFLKNLPRPFNVMPGTKETRS